MPSNRDLEHLRHLTIKLTTKDGIFHDWLTTKFPIEIEGTRYVGGIAIPLNILIEKTTVTGDLYDN